MTTVASLLHPIALTKSAAPRVAGCPFLGLLPLVRKHGSQALIERLWTEAKDAGLAHGRLAHQPVVVLRDPALVRQFFNDNREKISPVGGEGQGPLAALGRLLGDNIFTVDGEPWKKQRNQVLRHFGHRPSLEAHLECMVRLTNEHLGRLVPGEPFDLTQMCLNYSVDIACQAVLGMTGTATVAGRISAPLLEVINLTASFSHTVGHAIMSVLLRRPLAAPDRRERRLRDQLRELMAVELLRPNVDRIKNTSNLIRDLWEESGGSGNASLETEEVFARGTALLFASHETTASTLAWTAYELARHPEAEAALRRELDEEIGAGPLTYGSLRRLKLMEAIINEVLRLHPPAPALARTITDPLTLTTRAGSIVLERGTYVLVSTYLNQRDPQVWSDADSFKPDRFADRKPVEGDLLSFGMGDRHCAGKAFALQEIKILLALMVPRMHLDILNIDTVQPDLRASLRTKEPIRAIMRPA